jgi:hypothetical protein
MCRKLIKETLPTQMILDDIAFRSLLGKKEEIQYVAHKHAFTIQGQLYRILFFGIVLPVGGYFLLPPFYVLWGIWAGLGVLLAAYRILQWYLDAWIITNFAVIDNEWESFFSKATTRIEYQSIEGVSTEIRGFWSTIMNYGDIQIEHTSAAPVILKNVAYPRRVERHIVLNQQNFLRQQNFQDQSKLKDLLTNLLRTTQK